MTSAIREHGKKHACNHHAFGYVLVQRSFAFSIVSSNRPRDGAWSAITRMDPTHASVTYTPEDSSFERDDGFDFIVSNCGVDSSSAHVTINVVPGPTLTVECLPRSILLKWTLPEWIKMLGDDRISDFIKDFRIYRCPISSGTCTPSTTVYETVNDPAIINNPERWSFADTAVEPDTVYCYRITFRHENDCDASIIYESPYSTTECSPICCPDSERGFWTDQGPTKEQLATWVMGPGFTISNVGYSGAPAARGIFGNGVNANLPIATGVILSSGDIALARGPNDEPGAEKINDELPDTDLDAVISSETTFTTFDAAVLSFEIISATSNRIMFQYIFASEEYPDFETSFDDVVAIFVDGTNIALVPITFDPISIFTVNSSRNSSRFLSNPLNQPAFNLQYNGLTTLLTAEIEIATNVTHTVKIAIADTRDRRLDSAVFIKAQIQCP